MSGRFASLAIVVAAMSSYHIAQRSMPSTLRPVALFAFVYGTATVAMIAALGLGWGGGASGVSAATRHWAPWLLVASVVGIEFGVLAMYRAGWGVAAASTSSQTLVAAVLVVVGLVAFGEHLTTTRSIGLVMCLAGAALVVGR